jgi:hypothetical protein
MTNLVISIYYSTGDAALAELVCHRSHCYTENMRVRSPATGVFSKRLMFERVNLALDPSRGGDQFRIRSVSA